MKPKYVVGNLFELMPDHVVIPHICNDIGGWGSGFVVPLAKIYPEAERAYRDWHERKFYPSIQSPNYFELGNIQIIPCGSLADGTRKAATVINMIAQHGTINHPMDDDPNRPPVRYNALAACLRKVAGYVVRLPQYTSIHAPKFGAGLAGGNWDFIEELIREEWLDRGIPVTIYSLE